MGLRKEGEFPWVTAGIDGRKLFHKYAYDTMDEVKEKV